MIASYTANVFRWDPSVEHAIDFACQVAGRDLSDAEWGEEFPGRPRAPVCPQAMAGR